MSEVVAGSSSHDVALQGQRLASLARFKSGQVRILIATDVASRSVKFMYCHMNAQCCKLLKKGYIY